MTARILYAWELGGGLGHLGPFLPLARRLRAKGARVDCAIPFTAGARAFLSPEGLAWLQAPVFRDKPPAGLNDPPLSFADILLLFGYADVETLWGLVGAWRRLIELAGSRLVLADHAPTAILAARTLDIPVMLHATGFQVPPAGVSLAPAMRPWAPAPAAALAASEARALASINAVLQGFGATPLSRLAELFEVAEAGLATFPELDAYPDRRGGRYWGTGPAFSAEPPAWPEGEGPRIYAYLRAGYGQTEAALEALLQTRCRALVFCPDATPAWAQRFAAPHLRLTTRPVDLARAGREADAAIVYAQHGTTAALLREGAPLVLLPEHLEQGLVAWRVETLGAGVMVGAPGRFADPATALEALLGSGACKAAAMAFARRYRDREPAAVVEAMAARAMQLASPGAAEPNPA